MINIEYRESDRRAMLSWDAADTKTQWIDILRRLLVDYSEDASQDGPYSISLPWWAFVSLRHELLEVFRVYGLGPGRGLTVSGEAADLLREAKRSTESYGQAVSTDGVPEADLTSRLNAVGFQRELSTEQLRNVRKIAAISSAATFSVPGAGKTTEALACFFFRALEHERLLVIAPKNAFAAWDEQLADCMPALGLQFTRLRGGRDRITKLLSADPPFMLLTYHQLARVSDVIAANCAKRPTHVYLDESHRIKSGVAKQTARAALSLSHLPVGKLIMSGTPMPQAVEDLVPQFAFLYPEIRATAHDVVRLIRPVYVRTNKKELGLPPITRIKRLMRMAPMQHELYKLMKSEVAREANALSTQNRQSFRSLGRSVSRLLRFVSNPALLVAELSFAHPDLLAAVLAEGDGPKVNYVIGRVRDLVNEGQKVLVWSSFVKNVEYLADRFSDIGAVYIHGGVDAGDEDDDETREGKIKLFHDDPNVRVLVANPAAASEGVSLHRVCHHAIYLDRTFNAAHYLQSVDRIHRFGLPPDQETTIELVECIESVDETVQMRLDYKIGVMAEALEDSSLRPDPITIDPGEGGELEEYSAGLDADDVQSLLAHLSSRR